MAIKQNPFVAFDKGENIVTLQKDGIDIVPFYRYILLSGCPLDLVVSNFYQNHINKELLYKIQEIQYGFEMPDEKIDDYISLLKFSPSALYNAITPNRLFYNYMLVGQFKNMENMKKMYESLFMKMLVDGFVMDLQNHKLSQMYYDYFKITNMEVSNNIKIVVNGKECLFESNSDCILAKLQGTDNVIQCLKA
jgi:hypothetical protein